ncbi:hypothetical protein VSVS12_04535 (plasmid) [Vibrio scophthalmi]|nr:hypothetical protein VSVS12_04535 [Vibrio scophthalmi]
MAKKRGGSPLGNAPGSMEAQKNAAKANVDSLAKQLSSELENRAKMSLNICKGNLALKPSAKR